MSAETCAHIVARAAARRKREVIIGTRGKIGVWLKLVAPGLADFLARRAIRRGR